MSEIAVQLDGVSKRYEALSGDRGFVLEPVSISMDAGSWTAITGRSGAGKTTLLQIIALLDRPDDGVVTLFGRDVTSYSGAAIAALRRDRLGIVYQQFYFIDQLSVWQNITCRLVPEGVRLTERRRRAAEILAEFDLTHALDRRPRELSGGEQQRVALARAVIGHPDLLIADEPTSNVDAKTAAAVVEYLERLRRAGTTVVVSTHDPAVVKPADHQLEIESGRVKE